MPESFFDNQSAEESSGHIPSLDGKPDTGKTGEEAEGETFRTQEGRLAAIMSYIPFLCFIPLLNMKHNDEARFHARQGVMLFLIDRISNFVFTAVLIVAVAFSIAGIYFALQGKNYRLPIIGDLAEKFKL